MSIFEDSRLTHICESSDMFVCNVKVCILLREQRLKVLLSNFKINIVVHAFWAAHDFQIGINIFMHL